MILGYTSQKQDGWSYINQIQTVLIFLRHKNIQTEELHGWKWIQTGYFVQLWSFTTSLKQILPKLVHFYSVLSAVVCMLFDIKIHGRHAVGKKTHHVVSMTTVTTSHLQIAPQLNTQTQDIQDLQV